MTVFDVVLVTGAKAYEGVAARAFEVLADELSVRVKSGLAGPIESLSPQLAAS